MPVDQWTREIQDESIDSWFLWKEEALFFSLSFSL